MRASYSYIIILILLHCSGCGENGSRPSADKENKGVDMKITVSAGELLADYDKLAIPSFFNLGHIINYSGAKKQAIHLSKSIKSGQRTQAIPVALFQFRRKGVVQKYIITKPETDTLEDLDAYTHFMSYESELKTLIENWFRVQCDLGECDNFSWSNAYKAYLDMNEPNEKTKG